VARSIRFTNDTCWSGSRAGGDRSSSSASCVPLRALRSVATERYGKTDLRLVGTAITFTDVRAGRPAATGVGRFVSQTTAAGS
jgi:hypothetical protein